jgi:hypothetical protein
LKLIAPASSIKSLMSEHSRSPDTVLRTAFQTSIIESVSRPRLLAHVSNTDDRWNEAIGRYRFDIELARALHPVLNWSEVVLRNHLHSAIGQSIGSREWLTRRPGFLLSLEDAELRGLLLRIRHLAQWRPRQTRLSEDLVIGELAFGFWTRLLGSEYANRRLRREQRFWPALLEPAFPRCPPERRTRAAVSARFAEIRMMRNRVAHYRRVTHLADPPLYDRIVEAIGWMNDDVKAMLVAEDRPRFVALHEAGAQPWIDRVAHWQQDADTLNDRGP